MRLKTKLTSILSETPNLGPALVGLLLAFGTLGWWCRTAVQAAGSIGFRYAHNYAEPVVAAVVLRIPVQPLLYHNFQNEPYIINPYNPLYYYLSYFAALLAGNPLAGGRWVSFAAGILSTLVLYLILRLLGKHRIVSLIFAALFVHLPVAAGQWVSMRPDITALAFSLCGLACFINHERLRGSRDGGNSLSPRDFQSWIFYGAGVLFSFFAFFTKQNFLSGAAAYFLFLLTEKRIREAVGFGSLFGAMLVLSTAWLNWATDGVYMLNQQMSIQKPFFRFLFVRFWHDYLLKYGPLAFCAIAGAWIGIGSRLQRIVVLYFFLNLVSSVTLGKIGADINYFVEISASICLLSGLFLDRALDVTRRRGVRAITVAAVTLACLQSWLLAGLYLNQNKDGTQPSESSSASEVLDELTSVIKSIRGPVLAENMGILLAADKPILYEPFEFTQLAEAGVWDERKILEKIENHYYSVIVLQTNLWRVIRSSRFSEAFVLTLKQHYRPVKQIAGQIICIPTEKPAGA